jgi:fatty acid desaturase
MTNPSPRLDADGDASAAVAADGGKAWYRSRRDYQLIGGAGEQARSRGLVGANWYKSAIPRASMKALMQRSDRPAIRNTVIWYALILGAGVLAFFSLGTLWALPAFFLYGTLYAGPADSRWH